MDDLLQEHFAGRGCIHAPVIDGSEEREEVLVLVHVLCSSAGLLDVSTRIRNPRSPPSNPRRHRRRLTVPLALELETFAPYSTRFDAPVTFASLHHLSRSHFRRSGPFDGVPPAHSERR